MLLCGTLVSTLFHDVDVRLITWHSPSFDGVVLITGKMLELQQYSLESCYATECFWY